MAAKHRIRLPETLREHHLLRLTPDERGWFRFQRLYDAARACVRDEQDMRRLVLEAAQDDAAEGSRWLEMQVDPTSYAVHVGGLTPALEIVLDAAREATRTTGCEVAIVVGATPPHTPRHGGRLRPEQRRAPRRHRGVRPGVPDREAGGPGQRPAQR